MSHCCGHVQASGKSTLRRARQNQRPFSLRVRAGSHPGPSSVQLGRTVYQISPLGLGTLQWGDPQQGFGTRYNEEEISAIYDTFLRAGVNFLDTAEVYGYQGTKDGISSESILGRCLKRSATQGSVHPVVVGTKFFTVPWTNMLVGGGFRTNRQAITEALRNSLKRLDMASVDLYSVHFPFPAFSANVLSEGLKEAVDLGLCKTVGVCNYNAQQLEELANLLSKSGIPVVSNQVKYSLLSRGAEQDGLLAKCKDMGVTLVAHTPLEQGLLTSKYVTEGGPAQAEKARPVLKLMQFIGALYGGKTVTQIALNYLMQKGAVPIPGCKSVAAAQELVGALGWQLEENEVAMLEEKLAALKL